MCWECQERDRGKRGLGQRRGYSDDAVRKDSNFETAAGEAQRSKRPDTTATQFTTSETGPFATVTKQRSSDEELIDSFGIKTDEEEEAERAIRSGFFSQRRAGAYGSQRPAAPAARGTDNVFEQFEAADAPDEFQSRSPRQAVDDSMDIPEESLLNLDYKGTLEPALRRQQEDLVTRCLFAGLQAHDTDFIAGIPETTFSEIVSLLAPARFVADLGGTHVELSSSLVESMGMAPMRDVAFQYSLLLRRLVKARRDVGKALTLEDYTIVLKAARDLGNAKMAEAMWECMRRDGHKPSTACYNYFMGAIVWNGSHNSGSRQKVRVVPFVMLGRSAANRMSRLRNYRVGDRGIKETIMGAFNGMLANGAVADQESFRVLITACARDGDIETARMILMRVWGINVSAIISGEDESTFLPKFLPPNSPLQPTTALLFTIAHAFGINNDVPSALRVVDFVARHYQLEITSEVWHQLFEWTFVLSMQRPNQERTDHGTGVGKISIQSVTRLWSTMTGAPYHVEPTMGMYNYLIAHLGRRFWTLEMVAKMGEAEQLLLKNKDAATHAWLELKSAMRRQRKSPKYKNVPSPDLEGPRKEWEYRDLIRSRDAFWFKRWVKLLLMSINKRLETDAMTDNLTQSLPEWIWRWRQYAPHIVTYETSTGYIELVLRSEEDRIRSQQVHEQIVQQRQQTMWETRRYVGNEWIGGRVEDEETIEKRNRRRRERWEAREKLRPNSKRRRQLEEQATEAGRMPLQRVQTSAS